MNLSVQDLIKAMNRKGHAVFENDSKPYNINHVGVRDSSSPGKINDSFHVFYRHNGLWSLFSRMGTTDPGLYWLKNPMNVEGTAILKEGQMRGAWQLGKHRNRYTALVQRKPVTVIRDFNKDGVIDLDSGREETGLFGINQHRMHPNAEVSKVGKYSAGCQVTWNPDDYDLFIHLCQESAKQWGNSFSYTLMNIGDF